MKVSTDLGLELSIRDGFGIFLEFERVLSHLNSPFCVIPSGCQQGHQNYVVDSVPGVFYEDSLDLNRDNDYLLCNFKSDLFEAKLYGCKLHKLCDCCVIGTCGMVDLEAEKFRDYLCDKDHIDVFKALFTLTGSYSLIYVSLHTNYIYIIKDEFGLKSLLIGFRDNHICISNLATDTNRKWYEIQPFSGIVIGSNVALVNRQKISLFSLFNDPKIGYEDLCFPAVEIGIEKIKDTLVETVINLSRKRAFRDCVTVLFSGGLDSALIAHIVAEHVKDIDYLELANIAFKFSNAPDRITALYTYEELLRLFPDVDIRLICIDVDPNEYGVDKHKILTYTFPNITNMDLNIGASLYYAAGLKGYLFPKEFFKSQFWSDFRGNSKVLKSIYINVTVRKRSCDEFPSHNTEHSKSESYNFTDPSIQCLEDRCIGLPDLLVSGIEYRSQSSHVFVGTGADELFGGYSRHVSARTSGDDNFVNEIKKDLFRLWRRNLGRDDRVLNARKINALYPFLHPAMTLSISQLPFCPFGIVDLLACPDWFKALGIYKAMDFGCLQNCEFLPDPRRKRRSVSIYVNKWILREIASRLGFKMCPIFRKRAIQFGSRSAKTYNKLRNISNRAANNKGAEIINISDIYIYILSAHWKKAYECGS